ncbi:MAG: sigma 54-interacting transcriptional regulator [Candidatus Atribacteria bacterium]|nr:sigma 54-interacting transcriptional regulator [Candidatus Atribacteria bacterium]
MKKRIAVMSHSKLTKIIKKASQPEELGKIIIIESSFDKTKEIAQDLWENDKVDVFVCGSSNLQIVKDVIPAPIVPIKISGFDIIENLIKAKSRGSRVVLISYKQKVTHSFSKEGLFNIDISEECYNNITELKSILNGLKNNKENIVIGSSLVCDLCDELKIDSILIYSEDSIKNAINQAIQIQESIQREKYKIKQFNTILNFTYSGIIATDKNNIIQIYNPMAENILEIPRKQIIGKNADNVIENSRLSQVLQSKRPEIDQIQRINGHMILTSRIPIIVRDQVEGVVATFRDVKSIEESERKIRKQLHSKGLVSKYTFLDIKGESRAIKECLSMAKEYSSNDFSILISGETGTGKELFAHSIHHESQRKNEAFVVINCAALPESILESELFGYVEGAFTGAKKEGKVGLFELAHNGTILLDEISEAPLSIQSRLLRVIQEKEVMRLGSDRVIKIDTRIITTTNKNLWNEVVGGRFREDLYYRLSVLELNLPPLRERRKDIPVISRDYIKNNFRNLYHVYKKKWEDIFLYLEGFEFYGNVRELQNVLKRLALLIQKRENISPQDLISIAYLKNKKEKIDINKKDNKKGKEIEKILEALNLTAWDKGKAAQRLGISRTTLWRKLKIYGLEE